MRMLRAAVMTGQRRFRVRFGPRLTATVDLRGLPAGTYRVRILMRVRSHGHPITLRAARTYHLCVTRTRRIQGI